MHDLRSMTGIESRVLSISSAEMARQRNVHQWVEPEASQTLNVLARVSLSATLVSSTYKPTRMDFDYGIILNTGSERIN